MLADLPVEVVSVADYPEVPEVAETGNSFRENAVIKAKTVAEATGEMALADDSGLMVDVLDGEPGIYTARYGKPGWTDRERYEYLLSKVSHYPFSERTARFVSAIAVVDPANGRIETAEGSVSGIITDKPAGNNGFGYDPVFYLPEYGKTMAELTEAEKNRISHRANAIRAIKSVLRAMLG